MREVKLGDKILHMPDDKQRAKTPDFVYACHCHVRLGNDFYFLPIESCLRPGGVCDKAKLQ